MTALAENLKHTTFFYFCQNLKVIGRYSFRASCTAPEVVERLGRMTMIGGLACAPIDECESECERASVWDACACPSCIETCVLQTQRVRTHAHVRTYPSFNKTGATTLSNHAPVRILLRSKTWEAPMLHSSQSPRRCCLLVESGAGSGVRNL